MFGNYTVMDMGEKAMSYKQILEIFNEHECKRILDAGCGTGRFVELDKRIEGIDLSPVSHPRIKKGSVTDMPFKNRSFDGVLSYQVIEHLLPDNAYKMLSECWRVLKTGGILIIDTPDVFDGVWDTFSHIRPYSPKAIVSLLHGQDGINVEGYKPLGFKILKIYYQGRGFPLAGKLHFDVFLGWLASKRIRKYNYAMVLQKGDK